jgi:hypothetical protein
VTRHLAACRRPRPPPPQMEGKAARALRHPTACSPGRHQQRLVPSPRPRATRRTSRRQLATVQANSQCSTRKA